MPGILKKIIPFLKLIRYPNLAIIILTQLLTYYFLTYWFLMQFAFPKGIWLLVSGSVLIAAAGYMINDLFDIDIDRINNPEKVRNNAIFSKSFIILSYSLFNIIALVCGLLIDMQIFFIFLFTIMLLLLYSYYFKRLYLAGNIVVSAMLSLAVYIVWIFNPVGNYSTVLFYIGFAFLSSLIREIVKDIEDMEGDRDQDCLTLPVVAGVKAAKNISLGLMVILSCLIEFSAFYLYFNAYTSSLFFAIYLNIFVVAPMVFIGIRLFKATERTDFHKISSFLKLMMLAGILSIITMQAQSPKSQDPNPKNQELLVPEIS